MSWNRVDCAVGPRHTQPGEQPGDLLAVTPRMFVVGAGAIQLVAPTASPRTSRFRWEYLPGSELFVVYSDGRDTSLSPRALPGLINRGFTVKLTRLFRL